LKPLAGLKAEETWEGVEHYGYRSFDRQWAIADNRVADFPRPVLWDIAGPRQVFLTMLTSTKLGQGPVATVTPYVPDLHHFRGSYGAKDVIPLWRDSRGRSPNVTKGLLTALGNRFGGEIVADDLIAYVYGLAGTPAYAQLFADELGEVAGPFRVPLTSDRARFEEVGALGRELLWWHTWGERFSPPDGDLPDPDVSELAPMRGYPDGFSYDASNRSLAVGTAEFGPVSKEVWEFEVSGLKVVRSWLGNRMAGGKGRESSELDDIRPERWTFTPELLQLIGILQHTIDLTPRATELLQAVIDGPLIDPSALPRPTDAERKPPRS